MLKPGRFYISRNKTLLLTPLSPSQEAPSGRPRPINLPLVGVLGVLARLLPSISPKSPNLPPKSANAPAAPLWLCAEGGAPGPACAVHGHAFCIGANVDAAAVIRSALHTLAHMACLVHCQYIQYVAHDTYSRVYCTHIHIVYTTIGGSRGDSTYMLVHNRIG